MASKYTYDEFRRAASQGKLLNSFSDADLKLAQSNPDAGMSLLKYKQDYTNAKTDEARALAHMGAENIRSSYGGYSGGGDGGSFYLNQPSPSGYTAAPSPTYESRYDAAIQDLLSRVQENEAFSYDAARDPLYSQYKKTYNREGQRATADALGQAAAASGGIPSSYAATAAAQAGNYYAAQLSDKIPELYEMAYSRYLNEANKDLTALNAVQGAEQLDYTKYLDELNQYNTDRSFGYQQYLSEIDNQTQARTEALEKALMAAQYGDVSGLEAMGVDTSNNPADFERQYTLAQLAAQYGDYSGLEALGITPDTRLLTSASSSSSGNSSGSDSMGTGTAQTGVLETMLSLGNDAYAYEYLVKQGYGTDATKNLYKMYLSEKEKKQQAEQAEQNAVTQNQKKTDSYDTTVSDYDGAIDYMKAQGVDSGVQAGLMTREEWIRRRASFKQSGNGSAEVKNYNSYSDYVQGYVDSAVGKRTTGAGDITEENAYDISDVNYSSVLSLNLGKVSYDTLQKLVEKGEVDAYINNGQVYVKWKDGFDARKYLAGLEELP